MKKEILVAISVAGVLFGLSVVSEFREETFRFSCPILLPENWYRAVSLIFPD